ncbi:Cadherin-10 Precursor [Triplophysa tibetana]|uniref:Cadherin-10 n=1 Tax=Triplophysa tibetana TaxID=1572043 RepID=A0A5A9PT69_9TELE|nr:Cadherin-10 Precursor [Triplophysa tibetana]
MIINQLTFLLLFCLPGWSGALIRPVPGISTSDQDGQTLHRTKRGWMWNSFFLLEEWTGTGKQYVGKLHSDMDAEDGSVKYVLTGDGAGTVFEIDENSGDIHAIRRLDREEKASYTLSAKAVNKTSGQDLERASEFVIKIHDINDNEPKFAKDTFVASVSEMSNVGAFVMRVTATDADDEAYGNSAKLVYSILQGQPYFSVEPETGVIRTALPNMIRENREHYQVVIQAKDMAGQMGGLSGTATVNITLLDVNNSPPRFPHSTYHLSTPESANIGSSVGRIKASDADVGENAELWYSILDGDGQDVFNVITDGTSQEGVITVKRPLDYETKRLYSLRVQVTNTHVDRRFEHLGPFSDTAVVRITVTDVDEPPVFSRALYIFEVDEDTPGGSSIGTVTARDPDMVNHMVKYTIDRHTDLERLFNIDSNNGTISTLQGLDRETSKWHNISVLATELSTALQTRVPVFIKVRDVNDNAPEFAMYYETFVCENVKAGQLIQTISAVDTDEPLVGHKFVFSLSTINPNFTIFDNEDNTARIMTRRGSFNRREMSSYLLPVVISDNDYPIQSSTSTLTVRVCACDSRGNVQTCSTEALLLSAGLSTGALVAILLCILILLMIVVLFAALRRQKKKEPLIISKEDVRDNVVSYNDEGGGEEDTQAFDIGTLRNPEVIDTNKLRRDIMPEMLFPFRRTSPLKDNTDVRDFINGRLQENDSDPTAPPYDSLATYAYEGSGSLAESLSSLESAATEGDQDFDYLSHWGPQFKKLADMYIGQESQRET